MKIKTENIASLLVIGVIFLILSPFIYDYFIIEPKKEKELVEYWGENSYQYLKEFDVSKVRRDDKQFLDIEKVFIIDTHLWDNVKGNITSKRIGYYSSVFGDKYVSDIHEANVIIWLRTIKGEISGSYTNGETAIRLNTEVNFIDKKTNTIFKSKLYKHIGEPPESKSFTIRNHNDYNKEKKEKIAKGEHNIYFGKRPTDEIIQYILGEINY